MLDRVARHPVERIGELLPWNLAVPDTAASHTRDTRALAARPAPASTAYVTPLAVPGFAALARLLAVTVITVHSTGITWLPLVSHYQFSEIQ